MAKIHEQIYLRAGCRPEAARLGSAIIDLACRVHARLINEGKEGIFPVRKSNTDSSESKVKNVVEGLTVYCQLAFLAWIFAYSVAHSL